MTPTACMCAVCVCRREVLSLALTSETPFDACWACMAHRHAPERRTGLAAFLIGKTGWRRDHAQAVAEYVDEYLAGKGILGAVKGADGQGVQDV